MDERIKELIKQLDLRDNDIDLERFAELVRQDEREACAKLCEAQKEYYGYSPIYAYLIRSRSKK